MTKFKFRAWDGKKMHQPVDIMRGEAIHPSYSGTFWSDEAKAGILMQYTGITDKNGKEIYEGDVMTHPDFTDGSKGRIEFDRGCVRFEGWDCVRTDLTKGEVVGNIFENPELLEVSE